MVYLYNWLRCAEHMYNAKYALHRYLLSKLACDGFVVLEEPACELQRGDPNFAIVFNYCLSLSYWQSNQRTHMWCLWFTSCLLLQLFLLQLAVNWNCKN